ncbi:MAG: mercuric reductase, partial [Anaerolineales bacterium]|nr:mercuric reductase [Anaerolineales bacterium]
MNTYDVIWIGTGQATGTVIPRLNNAGKKVAVIEGGRFGGTCVNYGCTPTKTLVASARAAHMARRGADFGVNIGQMTIDFNKVRERMNEIRFGNSEGLEEWITAMEHVDVYQGYGQFVDAHTVQVGDTLLHGETIVIHTGARPRPPQIPGIEHVDWLDNVKLLALEERPQHLIIVGGSYIGLEFGQVFRRLGSEVTVLERGAQLMFREDEDLAIAAREILEGEGIEIICQAQVQQVGQEAPQQIEVVYEQNGAQKTVQGSHVLFAVGRVPNSDKLNLEAAGVQTNQRGFIEVNDYLQTNIPHIYALGDVNGEGAFTHTSVNDGEIFWDYYSGDGDRRLSERITTYAMYIDPPLGRVGMSEKEARESGRKV